MKNKSSETDKPVTNWEALAQKLAARLMWMVNNEFKAPGSGRVFWKNQLVHWQFMVADELDQVPGYEIDRELLMISCLPKKEQKKALKELEASRQAKTD